MIDVDIKVANGNSYDLVCTTKLPIELIKIKHSIRVYIGYEYHYSVIKGIGIQLDGNNEFEKVIIYLDEI